MSSTGLFKKYLQYEKNWFQLIPIYQPTKKGTYLEVKPYKIRKETLMTSDQYLSNDEQRKVWK